MVVVESSQKLTSVSVDVELLNFLMQGASEMTASGSCPYLRALALRNWHWRRNQPTTDFMSMSALLCGTLTVRSKLTFFPLNPPGCYTGLASQPNEVVLVWTKNLPTQMLEFQPSLEKMPETSSLSIQTSWFL